MRRSGHALLSAFLLLSLSATAFAQSPVSPNSTSDANVLFANLLSKTGWGTPPDDVVATGIVRGASMPAGNGSPIAIQAKGRNHLRFEVTFAGNTTVTVVNAGRAVRISNGKMTSFSSHMALSMRVPVFPFMDALRGGGAERTLQYVGLDQLDGQSVDVLDIAPLRSIGNPSRAKRNPRAFRLWISRETGLLVQISFVQLASANPLAATTYIRKYADYRLVNGRLFPFHQEQAVAGRGTEMIVDFTTVAFDTGITDTRFEIPDTDAEAQ